MQGEKSQGRLSSRFLHLLSAIGAFPYGEGILDALLKQFYGPIAPPAPGVVLKSYFKRTIVFPLSDAKMSNSQDLLHVVFNCVSIGSRLVKSPCASYSDREQTLFHQLIIFCR